MPSPPGRRLYRWVHQCISRPSRASAVSLREATRPVLRLGAVRQVEQERSKAALGDVVIFQQLRERGIAQG